MKVIAAFLQKTISTGVIVYAMEKRGSLLNAGGGFFKDCLKGEDLDYKVPGHGCYQLVADVNDASRAFLTNNGTTMTFSTTSFQFVVIISANAKSKHGTDIFLNNTKENCWTRI